MVSEVAHKGDLFHFMPALFTNESVASPQLAVRSFAAKLADAVRLVEEVVAVAQRFLCVLIVLDVFDSRRRQFFSGP